MADKKTYASEYEKTDMIRQSEDGGGIKLTTQGKYIFGAKKQNVINNLIENGFRGTVDVNANNQSFIAVMNENSKAIDINLGSKNQSSLFSPSSDNNILYNTQNTSDDYDTVITSEATITIPKGKTGPISVLVFYPGIAIDGKIGKEYMPPKIKTAIPDFYNKYVIVIPHEHTTLWSNVEDDYKKELSKVGLTEKNLSIGVFSGSGNSSASIVKNLDVLSNVVNIIVMDPYPSAALTDDIKKQKNKGSQAYLMYNPDVWKTYSGYTTLINDLSNEIDTSRKSSVSYSHGDIPIQILLKYKTEIERNLGVTSNPPPPPSPSPSIPVERNIPKVDEEEGFELNLLPNVEVPPGETLTTVATDTYDSSDFDQIIEIPRTVYKPGNIKYNGHGRGLPPVTVDPVEAADIDTYVSFSKYCLPGTCEGPLKDWEEGLINPQVVIDLATVCKALGYKATVTCANRGHHYQAKRGPSRHKRGLGIDISIVDGVGVRDPATKIKVDNICDWLVTNLNYTRNVESGNTRAVLWQMADHYSHFHLSTLQYYSGWSEIIHREQCF